MTELTTALDQAGIDVGEDAIGNRLIRVAPGITGRAKRFAALQQVVATKVGGRSGALPWHLIAFDGVIGNDALSHALEACAAPHVHPEGMAIEWQALRPPRTERRLLSTLTIACLCRLPEFGPYDMRRPERWHASSGEQLVQWGLYSQPSTAVGEMWADSLCWHLLHLPMPLWGHLSGLQPISALQRVAWARLATGRVTHERPMESVASQALPEALDATNTSRGADTDASAMNALDATMKITASLSDSAQRRTWVQTLASKIETAHRCGPVSCTVMAWVLDMAESGTPFKTNAAATTIQQYARSIMWQLWKAFTAHKTAPCDMTVPEFLSIYETILAPMKRDARATAAKALGSWHKFLVNFQEAPAIRSTLVRDLQETSVDAQVIWPHELDRAAMIFESHEGDERLINGAQVLFHVACNGPFREDELARLRLANVIVHAGAVDIEITSSQLHGGLKSPSGQRVVRIANPQACQSISAWKRRRILENASSSDLLFGNPVHRDVYRRHAMIQLVNNALKQATGDRGSSLHGLRHSFVSEAADGLLRSVPITSIDRFALLGNETGHASPVMTVTHYCHRYEAGLRLHLDCGLRETVQWTSRDAAEVVGIAETTLRQQAHRRRCSLQDVVLNALQAQTRSASFLPIDEGLELSDYAHSAIVTKAPMLDIQATLRILEDRVAGLTVEAAASRHQVMPAVVKVLEEAALTLVVELSRRRGSRMRGGITLAAAATSLKTALAFSNMDLARRLQAKYTPVNTCLAAITAVNQVEDAVEAWKALQQGEHFSLEDRPQAVRILRFLRSCGVACSALRLRIAVPPDQPSLGHAMAAKHLPLWKSVFGEEPVVETCHPRTGRPGAYLIWTSKPGCAVTPAAAGETAGLSAWMFGVAVWADYKAKEEFDAQC